MQIPFSAIQQATSMATNGSPFLLNSVGRLMGLGDTEQKALGRGEIPRWAIFVVGAIVGGVGAVYAARRFPRQIAKITGE